MEHFERCIVVDSLSKPMAFNGEQFVYCLPMSPLSPKRSVTFALKSYRIKHAKELIQKHIEFRKQHGWETSEIQIIPFKD